MYNDTAEDVAKYFGKTPETVTGWARNGYPIKRAGETVKVKFEGALRVGVRSWKFNLKTVVNFIENLGSEEWVSRNVLIPQRMERKKPLKIGHTNSTSTTKDFSAALRARVLEQKLKQKKSARV